MIKCNGKKIDYAADIKKIFRTSEGQEKALSEFVYMLEENECERLRLKNENMILKKRIQGVQSNFMNLQKKKK